MNLTWEHSGNLKLTEPNHQDLVEEVRRLQEDDWIVIDSGASYLNISRFTGDHTYYYLMLSEGKAAKEQVLWDLWVSKPTENTGGVMFALENVSICIAHFLKTGTIPENIERTVSDISPNIPNNQHNEFEFDRMGQFANSFEQAVDQIKKDGAIGAAGLLVFISEDLRTLRFAVLHDAKLLPKIWRSEYSPRDIVNPHTVCVNEAIQKFWKEHAGAQQQLLIVNEIVGTIKRHSTDSDFYSLIFEEKPAAYHLAVAETINGATSCDALKTEMNLDTTQLWSCRSDVSSFWEL